MWTSCAMYEISGVTTTGELRHMFILLAIKDRVSPPAPLPEFSPPSLMSEKVDCFLPSREDMKVVQSDRRCLLLEYCVTI